MKTRYKVGDTIISEKEGKKAEIVMCDEEKQVYCVIFYERSGETIEFLRFPNHVYDIYNLMVEVTEHGLDTKGYHLHISS